MSDNCHVIRNMKGLQYAWEQVSEILTQLESIYDNCNDYIKTLNMATVAKAILEAALKRTESIGSHYLEE